MKKNIHLLFLIAVLPIFTFSQNTPKLLEEARADLEQLCSEAFAGRGYLNAGHKKAANFIAKRFNSLGMQAAARDSYGKASYLQGFDMEINLVREAKVNICDQELVAGKDFVVNRFSGSGKLDKVKVIDLKYGLDPKPNIEGRIVLIREGLPSKIANDPQKKAQYADRGQDLKKLQSLLAYRPAAVIILRKKLTAAFGGDAFPMPIIDILADHLPKKHKTASLMIEAGVTRIETQNVAATIKGTEFPDSFLVISAHYDHLGMYEDAVFAGANDNASGTVMLLSMAKYFAENPPKYSLLFLAFGGEECGLKGSRHYVEKEALIPLRQLKFLLNLDLMGNGVDGIMAVCGKDFPAPYDRLVDLNKQLAAVPSVKARKNAPNSDHYFFVENGVPSFFIYTMGGPSHYHDIYDNADNLLFSKYTEIRDLLIQFMETF